MSFLIVEKTKNSFSKRWTLVWFLTSLTFLYQFGGVFKAETKKNYPFFWWFFPYHRQLCEGKTFQKPDPTLKCYNFFRFFWPFKVEELNREPDLLKIHNFLPDLHRRNVIADYALKNGLKSPMYTLFTNSKWERELMAQFNFRDSYIRGLYPDLNAESFSTTKLAELMTGLNFTNLDGHGIHTQYYLKYGHILPHHDVYPGSDSSIFGRRFATMIVYLESAKSGGKTIFPRLGIYASLAPGDAIFWYNVLANGESDPGLIHGGCPIWEGRKTIATFWLRGFWQEFRKRCPLKGEHFSGFGE